MAIIINKNWQPGQTVRNTDMNRVENNIDELNTDVIANTKLIGEAEKVAITSNVKRKVHVQATQPTTAADGDIWIKI